MLPFSVAARLADHSGGKPPLLRPWLRPGESPHRRSGRVFSVLLGALAVLGCGLIRAAELIPPVPKAYFNDYAQVVPPVEATRLNQTLQDFERQTSDQILVAIYPKMESDSSIEDYTVRVAQSWKAGQKGKDNGAVLFVFVQDRKMFLQVGYGLEGALPDALAKRIIETEIKPRFRAGDFAGGVNAGVTSILAAIKGEYKGTGRTAAENGRDNFAPVMVFLLVLGLIVLSIFIRVMRGFTGLGSRRRRYGYWGGWTIGSGGFSNWGSSGGGSGWGGGGDGGFSAGGGNFGGGGAGGSW